MKTEKLMQIPIPSCTDWHAWLKDEAEQQGFTIATFLEQQARKSAIERGVNARDIPHRITGKRTLKKTEELTIHQLRQIVQFILTNPNRNTIIDQINRHRRQEDIDDCEHLKDQARTILEAATHLKIMQSEILPSNDLDALDFVIKTMNGFINDTLNYVVEGGNIALRFPKPFNHS